MRTTKCDHGGWQQCQLCRSCQEWQGPRTSSAATAIDFPFGDDIVRVMQGYHDCREHGLWVWPSSVALATIIADMGNLTGLSVLEIGPGLGLPGMLAGKRGAKVTFVDNNPVVLKRLAEECEANHLDNVVFLCSDFAEVEGRFEVIMGADMLYQAETPAKLAKMLGERGTFGYVVDPWRHGDKFAAELAKVGWPTDRRTESYARFADNALVRVDNKGFRPNSYGPEERVYAFDVFRKL